MSIFGQVESAERVQLILPREGVINYALEAPSEKPFHPVCVSKVSLQMVVIRRLESGDNQHATKRPGSLYSTDLTWNTVLESENVNNPIK